MIGFRSSMLTLVGRRLGSILWTWIGTIGALNFSTRRWERKSSSRARSSMFMTFVKRHVGGAAATVRTCDERPADDIERRERAVDDDGGERGECESVVGRRKDGEAEEGRRRVAMSEGGVTARGVIYDLSQPCPCALRSPQTSFATASAQNFLRSRLLSASGHSHCQPCPPLVL